jgi:hypothetical protein
VACSPSDDKGNEPSQVDAAKMSASELQEAEEALLPGKVCCQHSAVARAASPLTRRPHVCAETRAQES